ncbi:hypothetical protein [Scytonema sp. HK-05]|nr:hypothetical protein [Scytonema sp. HK-05]
MSYPTLKTVNSYLRSDACFLVGDLNPPPTLSGALGVVFPPTMKLITDN